MALCSTCSSFDIQRFKKSRTQLCGYDLATVEAGGLHFCPFCRFLCDTLRDEIVQAKQLFKKDCWIHLSMTEDAGIKIKGHLHDPTKQGLRFNRLDVVLAPRYFYITAENPDTHHIAPHHSYRVLADETSPAFKNGDVRGRYLGEDPTSSHHFSAIKEWIDECLKHPRCVETASGSARFDPRNVNLPTRCIDITQDTLSLKETEGLKGSYIILSHRWTISTGSSRTTVSNYEARKTGFSLAILPKAFQDTILVARILKVPYVWIDSICIIQDGDSGQDWLAEASKMSQYYQQSLLTLAVTNINNKTGSFLEQRPSSIANQLVRLPYRDINGRSKGHFYIQKREKEAYSEYVSTVRHSPLLVRGWVLQEWFLSRRIIYYTPSQLYFECKTNPARNECNETAHEGVKLDTAFQMRPREWVLSSILEKEKPLRELWCEIIELYSGLALTMPNKDRIRAIAGIAEETRQMILLQQKNGSSVNNTRAGYVAGLWLQDLHHGLLWEQVTDDIAQPSKCGSSSWSWASLLCPVKWQDRGRNDYNACKLLRVLCTQDHRHDSSQGNELIIEEDANLDRGSGFFLSDLWSPRTIESAAINSPSECFNITNASASITLKGRCKHVLLGKTLNRSEKEMLYSFTDCATPSTRAWKAICNLDSPQTPIGWASIESSATNEQLSFYDAIAVVALHVFTRKGLSGGIQFGRIGFTHEVYNVLFLDNVDGCKYKRIGVGRVFEQGFFASTPGQIFELI